MLSWEEKVKLKEFISDTVRWMCKDGLMQQLTGEFCVEGLIGVTVGRDELFMVSINERLCGEGTSSAGHTQTQEQPSTSSPSGHSSKRRILHAPDQSEDTQTATEEANNTKKARYSDSFSENITAEQIQDQDNSEDIQLPIQDNTAHVQEAGYSKSCEVIADGELIPDNDDATGSLLMSAEECETDFLLSPQTRSSSVTNSAANVKSPSLAVKTYNGKDIVNIKKLPPTECRMTRSSRKGAACGANLEVVKSAVCGKDINLSAQKITSDFQTNLDKNTTIAKLRNNCKKAKSGEKTVTKSTNAIDHQKPEESPRIQDVQVELHDTTGVSGVSVSPRKNLVNDDDDSDDAFDDVDDDLFSYTDGIVAAVETDKSNSLITITQNESRADPSSASPDRNQSSCSSGDEAVGDSVSRNQPHATDFALQFNIKSEPLDQGPSEGRAEGPASPLQITDVRHVSIVKPEPVDIKLSDDDMETEPQDDNVETEPVAGSMELEPQMDTGQPSITSIVHHLGEVTNSIEHDDTTEKPIHQIEPVTKPACQIDKDNEALQQMDEDDDQIPPMNETTKAVHQLGTTQKSLHQKGETTNSKHCKKYLCEECGKNFKTYYLYCKHKKKHSSAVCTSCNMPYVVNKYHRCVVISAGKKAFRCNVCENMYKGASALKEHYKGVHLGIRHKCPQCDKEFNKISSVRRHIQNTHKKLKPYICEHCGKSFSETFYVKRHIQSVHLGIRHKCPQCNIGFCERSTMRRHIQTVHEKVKLYSCEHCGKCFTNRHNLKSHRNIHLGIRHKCPVSECNTEFSRPDGLRRHIRAIHKTVKL